MQIVQIAQSARRSALRGMMLSLNASKLRTTQVASTVASAAIPGRIAALRGFSQMTVLSARRQDRDPLERARENLANILGEEISFESEQAENVDQQRDQNAEYPPAFADYSVKEEPGSHEVELFKTVGDYEVRVQFSANSPENESEADENVEFGQDEQASGDEFDSSTPLMLNRVVVVLSKPSKSKGAVSVDMVASQGSFVIENVSFLPDVKLALAKDAETQARRALIYEGYPFEELNEALQEEWSSYLDTLGINSELAAAVSEYSIVKGENEYRTWLQNLKSFVEA